MNKPRINILGGSGAGTSTLGRTLSQELGVPHFEADDYYHEPSDPPFQKPREPQERCALLAADLNAGGSWVLSGGLVSWEPCPVLDLTLVVLLWVPAPVRLERLRRRERQRFGNRIDPGGDMHETHQEFLDWASCYDEGGIEGKTLSRHEEFLASQTCPVLDLRGVRPVDELVAEVLGHAG